MTDLLINRLNKESVSSDFLYQGTLMIYAQTTFCSGFGAYRIPVSRSQLPVGYPQSLLDSILTVDFLVILMLKVLAMFLLLLISYTITCFSVSLLFFTVVL